MCVCVCIYIYIYIYKKRQTIQKIKLICFAARITTSEVGPSSEVGYFRYIYTLYQLFLGPCGFKGSHHVVIAKVLDCETK